MQHSQRDHKLEFMVPLVNDMVQDDPTKRPTIDEVVKRFEEIRRSLPWWKLRSRLPFEGHPLDNSLSARLRHVWTSVRYILAGRNAMPVPPAHPMHTFKF